MGTAVEERWQARVTCLSDGVNHIHDSKDFADVTFIVRGNHVKAHKLILASRSVRLAQIVNATTEIIVPKDISHDGFLIFLSFVYTNKLNSANKKLVVEAYHCAKLYEQKALASKCLTEMESWGIDVKDACDLLGLELDIPGNLREKCISFIRENGKDAVESEAFVQSNDRAMTTILKSDALKNVPVLQRIESVMKWGKQHFDITTADYSAVRQKLLNSDPPLLGKLEMKNLDIKQFPMIVRNYPRLLTEEEVSMLVVFYASKDPVDLPAWCTGN